MFPPPVFNVLTEESEAITLSFPLPVFISSACVLFRNTVSSPSSSNPHKKLLLVLTPDISELSADIKSFPLPVFRAFTTESSMVIESMPLPVFIFVTVELYIFMLSLPLSVSISSIFESYIVSAVSLDPPFIFAPSAPITITSPVSEFSSIWTFSVSSRVISVPFEVLYVYVPVFSRPNKAVSSFASTIFHWEFKSEKSPPPRLIQYQIHLKIQTVFPPPTFLYSCRIRVFLFPDNRLNLLLHCPFSILTLFHIHVYYFRFCLLKTLIISCKYYKKLINLV